MLVHSLVAGVSALGCFLVVWFLRRKAARVASRERPDGIRQHLEYFSWAWALLGVYYVVTALWVLTPSLNQLHLPILERQLGAAELAFHAVAVTICGATNYILLSALAALSSVSSRWPTDQPIPDSTRPQEWYRMVSRGLASVILLSAVALLFGSVVGAQFASMMVVFVYGIQLIASTALFGALAIAYLRVVDAPFAATVASLYGLAQLAYPYLALVYPKTAYSVTLVVLKFAFGVALVFLREPIVAAHERPAESRDPLRELGRERMQQSQRLKHRVEIPAGIALTGLVVTTAYLVCVSLFAAAGIDAWLKVLRWLFVGIAMIVAPLGLYVARRMGACREDWEENERRLPGIIKFARRPDNHKLWDHGVLTPGDRITVSPDARAVVMLHGIYSHNDICWGLLPAILVASGEVHSVHLLSYRHWPLSWWRRFKSINDTFPTKLKHIAEESGKEIIVFGHSLGSLIAILAAMRIVREKDSALLLGNLRHICCVGTPIKGSWKALGGFYWPWCWRLWPLWGFHRKTLRTLRSVSPPIGRIIGESDPIPTFSFAYGAQDQVAGPKLRRDELPGDVITLDGSHSTISALYLPDSADADTFVRQLRIPTRAQSLMYHIAAHLLGLGLGDSAYVFRCEPSGTLEGAVIVDEVSSARAGKRLPSSQEMMVKEPKKLQEALALGLCATTTTDASFDRWWCKLRDVHAAVTENGGLGRLAPGRDRGAYLFVARDFGFLVLTSEANREALRDTGSGQAA